MLSLRWFESEVFPPDVPSLAVPWQPLRHSPYVGTELAIALSARGSVADTSHYVAEVLAVVFLGQQKASAVAPLVQLFVNHGHKAASRCEGAFRLAEQNVDGLTHLIVGVRAPRLLGLNRKEHRFESQSLDEVFGTSPGASKYSTTNRREGCPRQSVLTRLLSASATLA